MDIPSRLMLTVYRIRRQTRSGHSDPGPVLYLRLPSADYRYYREIRASLDGILPAQVRSAHRERSAFIVLYNKRMAHRKKVDLKASYQMFAIAIAPDGIDH